MPHRGFFAYKFLAN